jgi:hypothetical protein
MILYVLFALSIGIEGGYDLPAVGFKEINTGAVFALTAGRNAGIADVTFSLQASFYSGDNPGYSMSTLGFRLGLYKKNWPLSPILSLGSDYVFRSLDEASENGFAAAYTVGLLFNFRVERLHVYPRISYEGLTDMKEHAGFISLRLGISYEL